MDTSFFERLCDVGMENSTSNRQLLKTLQLKNVNAIKIGSSFIALECPHISYFRIVFNNSYFCGRIICFSIGFFRSPSFSVHNVANRDAKINKTNSQRENDGKTFTDKSQYFPHPIISLCSFDRNWVLICFELNLLMKCKKFRPIYILVRYWIYYMKNSFQKN